MALYSSLTDKCVDENTIAFGEIGLGGELRSVSHITQRIIEAQRLGFETVIVPAGALKGIETSAFNIEIKPVTSLKQAFNLI